ncbi:DNA polymerase gamma [Apiospora arundinis]
MERIFIIGGTGHIGGAVLHKTVEKYSDAAVTALVRGEEKAKRIVTKYPNVKPLIGDLESFDVIEAASRGADIVINAGPDITHDRAIEAVINGCKQGCRGGLSSEVVGAETFAVKARPTQGYYIHTSGASTLWDEPTGSREARTWDDVDDIQDIVAVSIDTDRTHAVTDKLVRDATADVNVAIISPGFVGGMSPSIEHPVPITTPGIVRTARAFKSPFQIAQGENRHAWIHVEDIADMYLLLVAKALASDQSCWGKEAYYFGVAEVIGFSEAMQTLGPVLLKHGVMESAEMRSVDADDAAKACLYGDSYTEDSVPPPADSWAIQIAILFGVNMRLRATRMTQLGWKPQKGPIVGTFDEVFGNYLRVEREAIRIRRE